ncbi:MAG TPA: NAD-glutamate dehydrogenase [Wenzhouxiangella sp.]|nr:NAD-glutamate dehydrogenase [Wenzhouxiangella sp.]
MNHPMEQEKPAQLKRILSKVEAGDNASRLTTFVSEFYRRVPAAELATLSDAEAVALASGFLQFAENRTGHEVLARAYNPSSADHGWESGHTIVEIVNDDMPFLVDSVLLALSDMGINAHLVIHPVLKVERDGSGRLEALSGQRDGPADARAESMMHVQVDRQSQAGVLKDIEERILSVLAEVRLAVGDWKPMLDRTREIADELATTHAALSGPALEEAREFFNWLIDDHFTFLGYREYVVEDAADGRVLRAIADSGLGIMHPDNRAAPVRPLSELAGGGKEVTADDPVIITKTNARSRIHRGGYMDYISVLYFDDDGRVIKEKRLIGLFTSGAYIRRCKDTPLVRGKVEWVLENSGLKADSHAGKALLHILETLPRDELFQASGQELLELSMGVLDLQERGQTRVFVRRERYRRFFSCLVFLPREQFNTENRQRIQAVLADALGGTRLDFAVQVDESALARVHFVVRTEGEAPTDVDVEGIETRVREAIRSWSDGLTEILVREHGEGRGLELARRFARAFPVSYVDEVSPQVASFDVVKIAQLESPDDLRMSLYRPDDSARGAGLLRFKIFKHGEPMPLSGVLPMLENLGMQIVSERPYELSLADNRNGRVWIQDLDMQPQGDIEVDLDRLGSRFQSAFEQVWKGRIENDGFNRLIMLAGLDWRQIEWLRACSKYLQQTSLSLSQAYMEETLASWPLVTRLLAEYFELRFDPRRREEDDKTRQAAAEKLAAECRELRSDADDPLLDEYISDVCSLRGELPSEDAEAMVRKTILRALDSVTSADEDRILRAFCELIGSILRTSAFQQDESGQWREYISFKIDSQTAPELPEPRPFREIWVYSPRVEGIHLRGGMVSRGGLRWSDRREDFRTEVLGLLRAQTVKNTMIVPVGAKGGFVAKQLPEDGDRDAVMAEVVACYKSFINGMLDITDNLDGERVVPPKQVVRHDGDDSYLVVAADKGTATFSDIANGISAEHGFWLDDAFASGGSNGYDHKKMGITARGAWESVKRHFRELGVDTQNEEFTVVGIGDMGGDVFGNGMLRSKHIRLKAAFNHMHIFIDPNPDAAATYKERQRLFETPRTTWDDFDKSLISKGGGVFSRQAKSIELSDEIRDWLGLEETSLTPHDLIKALLCAPVDLLWNGGIGTYVKGRAESHADVGDPANNPVRVNGDELRATIVGEGGNLGFTQLGRIDYAMKGGVINTDFIDNSGGVDSSDQEVNIKILLNEAVDRKLLDMDERNELLAEMTDELARLVLRSNYLQNQALSMMEAMTRERLGADAHFISVLESRGVLDRDLEQLPDDEELRERMARGEGLVRPELALLLSYSKMSLYDDLLASDVPEDSYLSAELENHFPVQLRERFADLMPKHRLWREIIATRVTNSIINRMGASFVVRICEDTGASAATVAKAYTVAREIFDARAFWQRIESLDNQVPAKLQLEAQTEMWNVLRQATRRLITLPGGFNINISGQVEHFAPGIRQYREQLRDLLDDELRGMLDERKAELVEAGFAPDVAAEVAGLRFVQTAIDIVDEAHQQGSSVDAVARVYFSLFDRLGLKWLAGQVERLPVERQWHAHARGHLRDDLYRSHRQLTQRVLAQCGEKPAPVEAWLERHSAATGRTAELLEEMRSSGMHDFAVVQVAINGLSQLLHATADN